MPWNQPWNQKSALLRLRSVVRLLALVLAAAVCLSCGGDDDDDGPTSPQEFPLVFTGSIMNLDCSCLHDIEVLFDGQVVTTLRNTNAVRSQVWIVSKLARRGQHQVAIRLTRQTRFSTQYLVTGDVQGFNTAGGTILDLELQDRLAALEAGESVSWSFNF